MDKEKNTCVCDCAWIYQFSYCNSCANDEYSGINRRPDGFKQSENRHDGPVLYGFQVRLSLSREEDVQKETEKECRKKQKTEAS